MFRFTIRDLLWLMVAVAIAAGMYWRQQHPPEPPPVIHKTVEVTIEPDGTITTSDR
jgi:hypothetical protein